MGTVSHVFSGAIAVSPELRSRVTDAARDLNYNPSHVARSLSVKRTNTLGMVITDITNPFLAQMIRGAEDYALKQETALPGVAPLAAFSARLFIGFQYNIEDVELSCCAAV